MAGEGGDSDALSRNELPNRPGGRAAWPAWARRFGDLYLSGTTSAFVLHGAVFDLFALEGGQRHGTLAEFVSEVLFGTFDLVLHYDLARGLRPLGGNSQRQREMASRLSQRLGDWTGLSREPGVVLPAIDRMVQKNAMENPGERLSIAFIISHAGLVTPRDERGAGVAAGATAMVVNWATSPYIKRTNTAFVLIDARLADVHDRIVSNPHVAAIDIPLPDEAARLGYLQGLERRNPSVLQHSDYNTQQLAAGSAGMALTDLDVLVGVARDPAHRLDARRFRDTKKMLIERQVHGLLEFIEPRVTLDDLVGHQGAVQRLREDAELIRRGQLDAVPMGYLLCGPVGTGKSHLARCLAGSIGIPCVELRNFRSRYVGETEGNLERVLGVLRSMGPVLVMVDEADAMLGQRDQGGDSGVSSRVFGAIARQMGDTAYRGRILWMLMTARPDLLPIDLKRQGRAEVHMPLFYPTELDEVVAMFVVMARKFGVTLAPEDVPPTPFVGQLSGADIEGLVGRARRTALLAGRNVIQRADLEAALANFMPSTQGLEREYQEIAALIECTDVEFLPPAKVQRMAELGGREQLPQRLEQLARLLGFGG
jgi:AAA+ superfamily predicted ATPase